MNHENCENCEWHDTYTWACSNGDSENCADFTDNKDWCEVWEEKEV